MRKLSLRWEIKESRSFETKWYKIQESSQEDPINWSIISVAIKALQVNYLLARYSDDWENDKLNGFNIFSR